MVFEALLYEYPRIPTLSRAPDYDFLILDLNKPWLFGVKVWVMERSKLDLSWIGLRRLPSYFGIQSERERRFCATNSYNGAPGHIKVQ